MTNPQPLPPEVLVELEPCPFCGSTNVDPEGWAATDQAGVNFRTGPCCDDCNASAETVELWNTRSTARSTEAMRAENERLKGALTKIDAIRNSIIGCQKVNWSEHVYPLVAALGEAGFEGDEYEVSRKNVGTLLEQIKTAELSLKAAREALERAGDVLRQIGTGPPGSSTLASTKRYARESARAVRQVLSTITPTGDEDV